MAISEQMLDKFRKMKTTFVDKQILFLCKNNKYYGVINTDRIYQQFKTAIVENDADAYKVYKSVISKWLNASEIEVLEKNCN